MACYLTRFYADVQAISATPTQIKFKAILTGDADGLDDYEFKLQSYNGVHYTAKTSYLTFVMPYDSDYMSEYNNRPNGEIQLIRTAEFGGNQGETTIAVGNPQSVNYYKGSVGSSFKISATKQTANVNPKTYDLGNVINITLNTDDERIFEVAGYNDIKAGDSIIYESETIEIAQVIMMISNSNFKYKLKELV